MQTCSPGSFAREVALLEHGSSPLDDVDLSAYERLDLDETNVAAYPIDVGTAPQADMRLVAPVIDLPREPAVRRNASVCALAPVLAPRQLVVIRTLAELGDRQAVADKLFLSPGTVKAHLRAIYKKLGAHNQTEALSKAAQLGLLTTAGSTT